MKLRVLSNYRNGPDVYYKSGEVIDVTDAEADFLFRDSPGSFEEGDKPKTTKTANGIASVDRQQKGGEVR